MAKLVTSVIYIYIFFPPVDKLFDQSQRKQYGETDVGGESGICSFMSNPRKEAVSIKIEVIDMGKREETEKKLQMQRTVE